MSSRSIELFLNDIIEAIKRIEDYTKNMDFREFEKKNLIVDAVIRNLEVIGEASKYIPEDIRLKHPELPWTLDQYYIPTIIKELNYIYFQYMCKKLKKMLRNSN